MFFSRSYRSSLVVSHAAILAASAGSLFTGAMAQPGTLGGCASDCPPSSQRTICYEAGRVDNFAGPVDPLTPRPLFASLLSTYAISKPFDDARVNAVCGTSFQNLPCGITSAILEIKMRAEDDIPDNDSIYLQWSGATFAWGSRISALPGAGGTWNAGQTQTFTLNLGTLTGGILNQMNLTHALDVLVADDTTVDYARLTITVCPCNGPARIYTVGTTDNMANPTEPTYRRSRLSALRTTWPYLWKDNDDCTVDRGWGNSFVNLPSGIVAADFNIRMKPCGAGSSNDGLAFDLLNQGAPDAWSRAYNINMIAPPWTTNPLTNFYFDLGATLPTTVCGSNLLGDFGDGIFDVYVQDDTGIDSARLRVYPCPPLRHIWGIPISLLGVAEVAPNPFGTTRLSGLGLSTEDGVAFDAHGSEGQKITFSSTNFEQYPIGTTMTMSIHAGPNEDGGDDVLVTTTVSKTSEAKNTIGSIRSGGRCAQARITDTSTGEAVDVCLAGGEVIVVNGHAPVAGGWQTGGGPVLLAPWWFETRTDMVLPNGQHFSGDKVEFTGDSAGEGQEIKSCNFNWGATATGQSLSADITDVVATVNRIDLHHIGQESTLNPNPGSVTLAEIGSSGQDGVTFDCGGAESFSASLNPVCGRDNTVECQDQPMSFTVTNQGEVATGSLGRSTASGRVCCFFDVFADFSDIGSSTANVDVADENGTYTGHFTVVLFENMRVSGGGKPKAVTSSTVNASGQRTSSITWTFDHDFAINRNGVAITGRSITLSPQVTPVALAALSGVSITATGMQELDIAEMKAESARVPCHADFNEDGGIDGADVEAFFAAWTAGLATADVNDDGGVDGADVATFFGEWEQGGC